MFPMKVFIWMLALGLVGAEVVTEINNVEEARIASEPEYEVSIMYLYDDTEDEKTRDLFLEATKRLEGFALFYSASCSNIPDFSYCQASKPLLLINKPPEYKVNPYTKKPMETQHITFTKAQLEKTNAKEITNSVLSIIPNYVQQLESDSIVHYQIIRYLNKVYLFTGRDQIPPMFKALAAHYKNRMLVSLVKENSLE